MRTGNRSGMHSLAMTAMMAAVLAVVSPFALPIGPVPISLCTFVIYLSIYVLGWKRAAVATLVYVLLGAAGMPVFSNFGAGLGKLLGPTGGYIVGYVPLAVLAGILVEQSGQHRWLQILGMAAGTAGLYAMGTIWICIQADYTVQGALAVCVLPFLPGDLVKIGTAAAVGPVLCARLRQAGLYPGGFQAAVSEQKEENGTV